MRDACQTRVDGMLTRAMAISVVLALLGTPCAANAQAIPPTKRSLADVRQAKSGHDYILRAIDTGRLILPDEVLQRLNEYSEENASNNKIPIGGSAT